MLGIPFHHIEKLTSGDMAQDPNYKGKNDSNNSNESGKVYEKVSDGTMTLQMFANVVKAWVNCQNGASNPVVGNRDTFIQNSQTSAENLANAYAEFATISNANKRLAKRTLQNGLNLLDVRVLSILEIRRRIQRAIRQNDTPLIMARHLGTCYYRVNDHRNLQREPTNEEAKDDEENADIQNAL